MANIVMIDKKKLSDILTGNNLAEMSRKIGYSANYLSNVIGKSRHGGKMSKVAINALDMMYGIKYDTYKLSEKQKEEGKEAQEDDGVQIDKKLYDTIYKAVYEAVKKAWSE